jgi:hypothetical protein
MRSFCQLSAPYLKIQEIFKPGNGTPLEIGRVKHLNAGTLSPNPVLFFHTEMGPGNKFRGEGHIITKSKKNHTRRWVPGTPFEVGGVKHLDAGGRVPRQDPPRNLNGIPAKKSEWNPGGAFLASLRK